MKQLLPLLALLILSACDAGQLAQRVLQPDAPGPVLSSRFAQAVQTGAPRMQLSVERAGAAGIVVLDTSRDGIDTWLSPEGAAFATRDGLLVATRGLASDMLASDVAQTGALLAAGRAGQAHRFHTFLTGLDQTVTRSFVCNVTVTGLREITLQNRPVRTRLMAEDCVGPDLEFRNLYWIGLSSGQVLQSRQWAGDRTGPLALRPLRQEG